ncbi:MAG: lysylphosphatidylglycerol synthase domain-containing protein [Pseudomonadota bacterium]|nr:lysylphosphatidylglycerol synthase domain-containing protein [Pseudomonadota bacterium]
MKTAGYIGAVVGIGLLIALGLHADLAAMLDAIGMAGWQLLWLVPYRGLYFLLFGIGWLVLLRPNDEARRATWAYVFWVTSVREAVDRLLPVASVGGGVVGVRLLHWRGLSVAAVSATVVVEIVLTLIASYAFTAVGLALFVSTDRGANVGRYLVLLAVSLPIPLGTFLLVRYGSVFARLQRFLQLLVGENALSAGAAALDREVRACLRRRRAIWTAGVLQFVALCSGTFEIWLAMRLFGHEIEPRSAFILESMTQAMRHLAFMIPGGVGVQEGTLVLFGHALGISGELALAVSMAKRFREVACGVPSLVTWQWLEGRRLRLRPRVFRPPDRS